MLIDHQQYIRSMLILEKIIFEKFLTKKNIHAINPQNGVPIGNPNFIHEILLLNAK